MRKTLTTLAASAGIVLALTGCGAGLSPADKHVTDLRSAYPEVTEGVTDADLIDLGESACEVLDSGYSVGELILALAMDPTLDHEFAGAVVGSAIINFCPEYKAEADRIVG